MHREIIINLNVHWSTRYLEMTAVRLFSAMGVYELLYPWVLLRNCDSWLSICFGHLQRYTVELILHEMRTLIKIRTNTGINNWKTYKYMNIVAYNLNVSQLSFCWLQKSLFINYSHCSFSMCIQYMYSVLFLKRALF